MTVELRPLGTACNLACTYCYQEPTRISNNERPAYDIDEMIRVALATNQEFSLFGGEALLVPKKDLEKLFKASFENYGKGSIQTNGSLIDEDHIKMFKKYNVNVGVSIDGPNELNELREVRSRSGADIEEKTLNTTRKIMDNLVLLRKNDISVGIIITLHQANASKERFDRLKNFILWLKSIGIKSGNIHTLEVDKTMKDQEKYVIPQKENAKLFVELAKFFEEYSELSYAPFSTLREAMMKSSDPKMCNWGFCDPMNTRAVYGIEGSGALSNCGRTNKEGIELYKTDDMYGERYISLYNTPQKYGGCKDCRFFLLCNGSCPGEAEDGDFRNKTIHCQTNKSLIGFYEKMAEENGIEPISKRKDLKLIESVVMSNLIRGKYVSIEDTVDRIENKNMFLFNVNVKGGKED